MTVSSSTNKVIVAGNGAQTVFSFGFIGVAATDISVIFTDASGNQTTLTQGPGATQYQVSLNAASPGALWGLGGTITYNPGGTPIAGGTTLTIVRTIGLTQGTSLQNQASFGQYAAAAESAMDLLEMQIQQIAESQGRVISAPIVDPATVNLTLPAAAQRANLALLFDASGNVIAGQAPAAGVISSAMAPVVSAASLAAGRSAFGLAAMATEGIGGGLADDGAGNARVTLPVAQISVNTTPAIADYLKRFIATGPINLNLNRANTYFPGYGFTVFAFSGAVSLVPNAADTIDGLASGASLIIPANRGAVVFTDAASAGNWYVQDFSIPAGQIAVTPAFQCQLTLSAGNLILNRFAGTALFINGANQQIPSAGVSLAPTGLTASTLYYIYAYMSAGVMTLEASTTAYAQNSTYGYLQKSGDATRSLVGMAYPTAGPAFTSSASQRLVRSYYNDPGYALLGSYSANRSLNSSVYAEINTEIRIQFLVWTGETAVLAANGRVANDTLGGDVFTTIAIDSTSTAQDTMTAFDAWTGSADAGFALTFNAGGLAEGFHFATLLGKAASGTSTWTGSGTAGTRSTLTGLLRRTG